MLAGLLFLIPALFFVIGMVRDRRRLSNAVWLGIALLMLLLLLAEAGRDNPVLSLPLLLAFMLAVLGLLLLPLALLANGLVMVRREGRSLGNLLSLLAGLALLGEMIYFFWGIAQPNDWIRGTAIGLFLMSAYIAFLFVSLLLYSVIYGRTGRRHGFDGIVVLGAGLIGSRVPKLLANRLDRAMRLYHREREAGRSPVIVVSGGRGADEDVSEAFAMHEYLLERGVPDADVVMEDQATTTEENLRYSKALLAERGLNGRVVAVTNNYHVFRTAVLSRKQGLRLQVIGAPTAWYFVPSAFLREFVALLVRNPVVHGLACAVLMAGGLALTQIG
ncbi:YdcF family protein [Lentzea sp. BCCO 10_0061]|uniref:YdcF family protein n=1 Tax=Lentzea sokolovensis TaxID=3095429 RepID=A0ABU4VA06_9PSEU|nr:YdcF family protein [Lentzea sp. BCCO 10_0061]MDX8147783.1 YdcF family protein [Lentzea sp. BCCO 10_0061]